MAMLRSIRPGRTDDPAVLHGWLRDLLTACRKDGADDPFANPILHAALEIDRLIDAHDISLEALGRLIQHMSATAAVGRAARLGAFAGEIDPAENEKRLRVLLHRVARPDEKGPPISAERFRDTIEAFRFGIVFTAHPTFSSPPEVGRTLAQLAAGRDADGAPLSPRRINGLITRLHAARHRPPENITLDMEFAWAQEAVINARDAVERLHRVVLEVAQELYPDRWQTVVPAIVSVASWVGYDHDGRSDIGWADTLRMHLHAKLALLRRLRQQTARLREAFPDSPAEATLSEFDALLAAAVTRVESQIHRSGGAGADGAGKAAAFARDLVNGRDEALTEARPLRALLQRAVGEAKTDKLELRLCVLDAALAGHGLTLAHPHFRINATQIHNAIRRQVGLDGPPTDPGRRRSYINAINELLEGAEPHTVNVASIMDERASARRMFMMIAELAKHIDGRTPVRFLIAETESAFTLLAALYFARIFGVEHLVEITPLLETDEALRQGDAIIAEALKSPVFRGYVARTGRLCIQFGHSDSGRYVGQMAATSLIERLRFRIAAALARAGMRGIQVVLFDTHGESVGRGGHPVSMTDRLRYLDTPASRLAFLRAGMTLKQEVSFQGGDGYMPFLNPDIAFAIVCRTVETVLGPEAAEVSDPIYREQDFSVEFFAVVRQEFAGIVADENYAALLGALGANLVDKTGSRPTQRQHDTLAPRAGFVPPSQIRAITNNAILQQLGMLANTITGVGRAATKDPEEFRFAVNSSPRFRRALAMVRAAMAFSDPDVLSAYVDTLDPGMWLIRSGRTHDPVRREEFRAVYRLLEPHDTHARLARIRRCFQADFLLLKEALDSADGSNTVAAGFSVDTEELALLHALRIALIHRLYRLATRIPDFTPQQGMTRVDALQRIFHLDVEDTVTVLRQVFPRSESSDAAELDFAEPASYRSDASQTYRRDHETILDPLDAHVELMRRIGAALTHHIGAVG